MKTIHETMTGLTSVWEEKGRICVSVITPTHKLSPGRQADPLTVRRTVDKAKASLREKFDIFDIRPIEAALDELYDEVDFTHNQQGIGFFVSENSKMAVTFPFPVTEKIIANDHFEIRDILYKASFTRPYMVLSVSEKEALLFEGSVDQLTEIRDKHFPMKHVDDYAYSVPGQANAHAGYAVVQQFEKDKSVIEAIRNKDFLQEVDHRLTNYLQDKKPLLILTPVKEMGWFTHITEHADQIIGHINGNYQHTELRSLGLLCWEQMQEHIHHEGEQWLNVLREKIGTKFAVFGLTDVWKAAREGRGLTLLVEKDFYATAFTDEEDYALKATPHVKQNKPLPDAVDDLIRMVLEKNGEVVFVENELLKDYNRIAMINRY